MAENICTVCGYDHDAPGAKHYCPVLEQQWERERDERIRAKARRLLGELDAYPIQIHHIPEEDGPGYYLAFLPDFGQSACSATGDTIPEAVDRLKEVQAQVFAYYRETGRKIPEPSSLDLRCSAAVVNYGRFYGRRRERSRFDWRNFIIVAGTAGVGAEILIRTCSTEWLFVVVVIWAVLWGGMSSIWFPCWRWR